MNVRIIDGRLANTDKLLRQILDAFQTNNLLVKFVAGPSRDAAEDHHHGAVRPLGERFCLVVVEHPAMLVRGAMFVAGEALAEDVARG